jgi:hypothetical protein
VLAGLLLTTVLAWLGVVLSLLEPVVAAATTALLLADVMALRASARQRRAGRSGAERQVGAPLTFAPGAHRGRPLPREAVPAAPGQTAEQARRPAARTVRAPLRRTVPPAAARRPAAAAAAGDVGTSVRQPAAVIDHPAADGTWMPIPVPPPTYTLKPMVSRPQPPALDLGGGSAAVGRTPYADATGSTVPAGPVPDRYEAATPAAETRPPRRPWDDEHEFADELDLDAVLARRRAVNG